MSLPIEPVKLWFFNLKKIQDHMKELNHLTDNDLKKFSRQKPSDLLPTETLKGNLAMFCQNEHIGLVFDAAFNEKTFLAFLRFISFSVEEAILGLFYRVAVNFKPNLLDLSPSQVAQMTMKEVYGSGPIESNIMLRELHDLLRTNVPSTFYPADGAPINDDSRKVRDAIGRILS